MKPGYAVTFRQDLRQGLTTALTVAGQETWLAAGTSSGLVSVWDLRFKLKVGSLCQPGKARVRRLGSVGPGQLAVSVQGNNELGVWSVESSSRQTAITSPAQQHSVTAFSFLSPDRIITAGTDCKLRSWSLSPPLEVLTLGQTEGGVHGVTSRLVEGAQVYSE